METIQFKDGEFHIYATIIEQGLGIEPSLVLARIREGKITSLCERGIDVDARRYRLTFFLENRRFRLSGRPTRERHPRFER
jgi:Family of unknown function (DUF6522)